LENLDYIKKFYDVDENKKSYSVTETGIKALIAWSKIHGFEDKLGVIMAYPEPLILKKINSLQKFGIQNYKQKTIPHQLTGLNSLNH